jgi:hypothetical protein
MEVLNPPDTSVPSPTLEGEIQYERTLGTPWTFSHLDSFVKIMTNRCDTAAQVEVTRRTMANAGVSLLDEVDFVLIQVDSMSKNGIMLQQAEHIVNTCIMRRRWEQLTGISHLSGVFGNVGLNAESGIGTGEGS